MIKKKLVTCMHALFEMNCYASWWLSSIFFFFLCSSRVDYSYARDTLKYGEWIIDNGTTTLVSSGGRFELGFFTPINTSSQERYVGIWYKQDQQTVVWVANRDEPVLNDSTGLMFGIAKDGHLVISNSTTGKENYWSIYIPSTDSTNRTVKLMDSGNLVVSDDDHQSATSLWESFKNPTDTVLPESTPRNCTPCGTNLIPYPLSTNPNCGDPMYFNFYCNYSTGQVSFNMTNGTYRVVSINPSTRKFVIQVKYAGNDTNLTKNLQLSETFSFNDSDNYSFKAIDEIEISWKPPLLEPSCNSLNNCKDLPNSTCNVARDGKRRCLCNRNFQWNGSNLNCTKEEKMSLTLIVMIPLIVVFLLASAVVCIYIRRRKMAKRQATNNFSDANKLGEGGYGPVYKGTFSGGQQIALKRLSCISRQGLQEFKNEVVLIAKLQHRNLVSLRGYCVKGYEKILLYEYMPNKSLDSFLFDQKLSASLDWEMRFKIILGIARGLVYLHHGSRLRIIHRDLKTSNILLDEEMNPKISDFGLARMIEGKETEANTTRVVGTHGYMSPEYVLHGLFSVKSDVFSFGVVLLEIISGTKNTGFYQSELATSLIAYAWRLWVENHMLDLVDSALHEVCNADQFVKCVNVGLLCVEEDPNDRPTMSNVVVMLVSEAAAVPTPKQPAFVPWRGHPIGASSSSSQPEITSSLGGR